MRALLGVTLVAFALAGAPTAGSQGGAVTRSFDNPELGRLTRHDLKRPDAQKYGPRNNS